VQWFEIILALKPGQLPFGVMPGPLLNCYNAFRFRNFAADQGANLSQTERLFRGGTNLAERSDFLHHTLGKHLFDPVIDSLVKLSALAKNEDACSRSCSRFAVRSAVSSRFLLLNRRLAQRGGRKSTLL